MILRREGSKHKRGGAVLLDVIAFGEALVYLSSTTPGSLEEGDVFAKAPAGAPGTVAVAVVRLGGTAGLICKAGNDAFGRFLKRSYTAEGVDTSHFLLDPNVRTGIAFTAANSGGERDFQFYFDPELEVSLTPGETDRRYIADAHVFHFGTMSLVAEPARSATWAAVEAASVGKTLIAFDPNLRLSLWHSEAAVRDQIFAALGRAHVVKLSEAELQFLYPGQDVDAVQRLLSDFANVRLVAVTYGAGGSVACTRKQEIMVRGFPMASVDTMGAGDAFTGAFLLYVGRICSEPAALDDLPREKLREAVRVANATGALVTAKLGTTAALPTAAEIQSILLGARHADD